MNILVVDDNDLMLDVLRAQVGTIGHCVTVARDGREAIERLKQGDIHLVITDWEMPDVDGVALCQAIRNSPNSEYVYVIMLTSHEGTDWRIRGLEAGADDFLTKPLNSEELHVCLKTANRVLSLQTHDVALFALAKLAESRDPDLGAHIDRVQHVTRILAQHLTAAKRAEHGVTEPYVRLLAQTTPLHDLGKVAIPDSVLLKPGKLTPQEYEVMKTHTTIGARTLEAALQRFPGARFLQMARDIAATHHEKYDGTGYPAGLAGERIPMCGRIVALADVYDALISRRVYKAAMSHEQARRIILQECGRHFDPVVVDAFLAAEEIIVNAGTELAEARSLAARLPLDPIALAAPEAEPAGGADEPESDGSIDFAAVRGRCGGDPLFAAAVVRRFRGEAMAEVDRLLKALGEKHSVEVRRAAHNLKSMAAYVSAEGVADLARQIEHRVDAGEQTGLWDLVNRLRDETRRVLAWLDAHGEPYARAS